MKKIMTLFLCCFLALTFSDVYAVSAINSPIEFIQPDGNAITVFLKGDEKVHWYETTDGYTLLVGKNGFLCYGIINDEGSLVPSEIIANDSKNRDEILRNNIRKGLFYSQEQVETLKSIWDMNDRFQSRVRGYEESGVVGSFKTLCVLVEYPDRAMVKTKEEFQMLMTQTGYSNDGGKGCVRDYFLKASYGKMDLTVNVVGPYKAPKNAKYYSGDDGLSDNVRELAEWAIRQADAEIDFSEYDGDNDGYIDGFHFVFAGHGKEAGGNGIWSHKWNFYDVLTLDGKRIDTYSCSPELRSNMGTSMTSIGVICHEMTHAFGAPDYYDTNYEVGGSFSGTGDWDLMASGSWNGSPSGSSPAMINMYQKIKFKWLEAEELSSPKSIYYIGNSADTPIAYRVDTKTDGEYFLIENRQKTGFDSYIPGSGLIIYRVSKGYGMNETHPQRVYPVCAGAQVAIPNSNPSSYGDINSAMCPFPGSSHKTEFTDETIPSAKSWAGVPTEKPITNIVYNPMAQAVSFDFMGGVTTDCDSVRGVMAEFNAVSKIVTLSWVEPEEQRMMTGYNVYRNGALVEDNISSKIYYDRDLPKGTYSYFVTANFENGCESKPSELMIVRVLEDVVSVKVSLNDDEAGRIDGYGYFEKGERVKLTASSNEGYTFVCWKFNNEIVSKLRTYMFTAEKDVELVAEFAKLTTGNDSMESGMVSVFSNNGTVFVDNNNHSLVDIDVIDFNGIAKQSLRFESATKTSFNLEKRGVYLIRIKTAGEVYTKKIIY